MSQIVLSLLLQVFRHILIHCFYLCGEPCSGLKVGLSLNKFHFKNLSTAGCSSEQWKVFFLVRFLWVFLRFGIHEVNKVVTEQFIISI